MPRLIQLLLFLFFTGPYNSLPGQSVLYWDMQEPLPLGASASLQVSALVQGNNFGNTSFYTSLSASQQYTGASGTNNAGLACRTGALVTGASGSAFLGITLSVASGYRLRIVSVSFGSRSTPTGPGRWGLFSSADQFTSAVYSSTLPTNSTWSWQQSTALSLQTSTAIELRLYGYEGAGTAAINVCNWRLDDLTIHYLVEAISLPVSWLYVKSTVLSTGIRLQWATAEEINNKEFIVERSVDGLCYQPIAVVPAIANVGPALQTRLYSFLDVQLSRPLLFYRIRQVDLDGSSSYSEVLLVATEKRSLLPCIEKLLLDPASGTVRLSVVQAEFPMQVQLYAMSGQLLKQKTIYTATVSMDIRALPAGVYYLQLISKNGYRSTASFLLY